VFPDPAWRWIDLQGIVSLTQVWFGDGCLAHMQGASIALTKDGGDPLLDG
jgi:hypothetical protein